MLPGRTHVVSGAPVDQEQREFRWEFQIIKEEKGCHTDSSSSPNTCRMKKVEKADFEEREDRK